MQRVLFFEGQDVLLDDLSDLQSYIDTSIKDRISDVYSGGVISGYDDYVVSSVNNTIKVKALTAYDSDGERIYIAADLDTLSPAAAPSSYPAELTTSSTGYWSTGILYYIVAMYFDVDGSPVPHPVDGTLNNTRSIASYKLYALRRSGSTIDPVLSNYVKLAEVSYDGSTLSISTGHTATYMRMEPLTVGINISTNPARPALYSAGTTDLLTLNDHINAIGTGTVSPTNPHGLGAAELGLDTGSIISHEQYMHKGGIIGTVSSTVSSLYGVVNWKSTGLDDLIIKGLTSVEFVALNGIWIDNTDVSGDQVLSFSDGTSLLPAGVYTVYIDNANKRIGLANSSPSGSFTVTVGVTSTIYDVIDLSLVTNNSNYLKLWEVTFSQTHAASSVTEVHVLPADGTSNFTTKTDLRYFGNTASEDLYVDAATDTFTIDHNLNVRSVRDEGLVGEVKIFAGATVPSGYLLCDGSAVSRTTYSDLFAAVGTLYGVGDGSLTFNVPDLRGQFVRGYDAGAGVDSDRVLGTTQLDAFQGHVHELGASDNADGGEGTATGGSGGYFTTGPTELSPYGTPRIAAETRPTNVAMNYIIRY